MADQLLTGCGTALATPFTTRGDVDERALRSFVDWQLDEGIDFVVPCGSTGEAATMSPEEHYRVVEITVEQVRGRVPVVAGAGSNDTVKAIELSRRMKEAGATHLLHVSPMYNKPPQRGLVAHFTAIADATTLPVVVYNVPGRTGSNVEAATTLELAKHPRITSVKEASGNLQQITDCIAGRPKDFTVLSGDDELTLPILALGGDGLISVVSNAVPRLMTELVRLARAGDLAGARELHLRVLPWMRAAFVESNPIPVKAALAMMGKMENVLRRPLVPLAESKAAVVRAALEDAGAR
ncbi:MAG: 4-hydroxy-tetrahydrodipicolinate synthase [Gemmatimonadaceae bacterium]|nr:4-hydroxy-tetrahydrodipicolinate synthase [Gemmatimonadaceae bacterium]NUO95799.1 4-hydroxy-tetrahydrodipicolinate synthase [Gemmatimonadaceae bacterium]NUP56522.1 4-hydroxy-tetrahydrodipicolinate synthase [Gemmatimonadaceae bacterium]NUP72519.1 4-hydroxy-tetrahydrodipicolinate synthase [Gemmatimonadaceae bacterium]NUR34905.1 4-hydroxy-tetrahydrodipicolinate synthase [Gemmatimonadaceae bacterium]